MIGCFGKFLLSFVVLFHKLVTQNTAIRGRPWLVTTKTKDESLLRLYNFMWWPSFASDNRCMAWHRLFWESGRHFTRRQVMSNNCDDQHRKILSSQVTITAATYMAVDFVSLYDSEGWSNRLYPWNRLSNPHEKQYLEKQYICEAWAAFKMVWWHHECHCWGLGRSNHP